MKTTNLLLITLFIFIGASCASNDRRDDEIHLVHWNIKELDTAKLSKKNDQLTSVKNILEKLDFDAISVNEIQYDLPNGKNLEKLLGQLKEDTSEFAFSFTQANTGNKAKKVNGKYSKDRKNADQVNYGLFPGQYSTGFASKHPIKEEIIVKDLQWKEFNPAADFSKFRDGGGKKLPKEMQLFDKSFTHLVIEVADKEVHIILLHTVPSYHFGNRQTPNYERNRDQLRFLEWYVTGATNFNVKLPKKYAHLKPIHKEDRVIIMGDFNTSIYMNNPGSVVLRRLFNHLSPWLKNPGPTNERQTFAGNRNPLTLDYIAYRGLKLMDSGIYNPETLVNKGNVFCTPPSELPKYMVKGLDKRVTCIDDDAIELKKASDHFPIWATFRL